MTLKHQRAWTLTLITLFLGGVTTVILTILNDHLLFFMTPTDVLAKKPRVPIRLGGIVEKIRVDHLSITFQITDRQGTIPVHYRGLTPDLFREGQGVVAEGTLSPDGIFQATYLLAKHDETYKPSQEPGTITTPNLF
jgi:cytochrome c-type biogenesis protein CcmE